MKKLIITFLAVAAAAGTSLFGQAVETSVGVDPANVCFPGNVQFGTQFEAHPLESIASIENRLNHAIDFAQKNPEFFSKPAVRLAINCRGEIGGGVHMPTRSGDDDLDRALVAFFQTVERWQPAREDNLPVDSWYIFPMVVNNGYIHIVH